MRSLLFVVALSWTASLAARPTLSFQAIQERHPDVLTADQMARAQIEGECLAGIYQNNAFRGEYNPISEWLRVRTSHLLQQHSPCELLVMLEEAKDQMEEVRAAEATAVGAADRKSTSTQN